MMEDLFPHRNHQEEKMGQDPREQKMRREFQPVPKDLGNHLSTNVTLFQGNGRLSQTALMINNKRELLKRKLIYTKIDECLPKLNFSILMESKLLTRYFYIWNMLGMSMKPRACVASGKVLGHMGYQFVVGYLASADLL